MDSTVLAEALEALRKREGIPKSNVTSHIGRWEQGNTPPALIVGLPRWAESRGIDAVLWTALPPKFRDVDERVPTINEVLSYLSDLTGRVRDDAERYIRLAPRQIDTPYRRKIEAALGWTPLDLLGSETKPT
jgi:hypothetical protein